MRNVDYIPRKDGEFDILQDSVYAVVSEKAAQWLIPNACVSALTAPRARWITAVTAYRNTAIRTSAVVQEKNDARKNYVSVLRNFIQGQLVRNSNVTDADRRSMGLPVYDRTPTKPGVPTSRMEMEVFFSQIVQHVIRVRDSETKSAAKPRHVIGFELWRRIGGETKPVIEEMQLVELVVRSPHKLEYSFAERGKYVWYTSRWVNTRGEKGPWSEFVSAIVP
jgi:hypothetical protein